MKQNAHDDIEGQEYGECDEQHEIPEHVNICFAHRLSVDSL